MLQILHTQTNFAKRAWINRDLFLPQNWSFIIDNQNVERFKLYAFIVLG